jgi:hypothetical protein
MFLYRKESAAPLDHDKGFGLSVRDPEWNAFTPGLLFAGPGAPGCHCNERSELEVRFTARSRQMAN